MCYGPFKVMRPLCHWGPIITIVLVVFITFTAIMADLEVFPPTLDHPWHVIHFLCLVMWPCLIFYNYFQAVFFGPGFVPLGWVPKNKKIIPKLQYCIYCKGFKAPRSHHCRQCQRCVMKMDHHCPWINTCCGHFNHTRFIYFLITAPLGCLHGVVVIGITIYLKLYQILYVATNPRLRHKFVLSTSPFINFTAAHLICCMVSIGAALGVTVAVGFLLCMQLKVARKNETGIETWIKTKAFARERKEEFIYPYDLGWKENLKQIFTWQGYPKGDGMSWTVVKGCNQYTLTVEQIVQKLMKKHRTIEYLAIEDYSGRWFPITKDLCTLCHVPISEEPRIAIKTGDIIMVTRWKSYWLYGDKCLTEEDKLDEIPRVRGWFPKRCVNKQLVEYTESCNDEDTIYKDDHKKTD